MMNVNQEITKRAFVVYVVSLAAVWVLTDVVCDATNGLLIGLSIARNPEYQQEIAQFLKEKGISPEASGPEAGKAYEKLSTEDREELMKMVQGAVADVNWFAVTMLVSAVVFGLVGFFGGLVARAWWLAGIVPALSFHINNPLVRFPMAKDMSDVQKLIVVVVAQWAICYLLAYCGAKLGLRWKRKKESAGQSVEATS